jgi:colanic acid biosynthesis glycosyl transferase WcaI
VQDLYPESLVIQERIVEKSIIFKLLMTLDAWIAKAATSIIVLSENFASSYVKKRGVDPTRMHIIPNWVEAENFENFEKDSFRQRSGISKEAFVIVYGGNIGYAAGVELVIDSLKEISSTREIVFLIAGDGSQMKFCQESAQAVKNIRVIFHNPWLAEETAQTLASADLLLLPTRGRQSLASVPSKLLSYLMSARPILALVCPDSDTAQIIEKAGCGWVIEPNSKDSFVKKILELSEYPAEKLADIGAAGRKYALEHFVDKVCLPGLIDIIIGAG